MAEDEKIPPSVTLVPDATPEPVEPAPPPSPPEMVVPNPVTPVPVLTPVPTAEPEPTPPPTKAPTAKEMVTGHAITLEDHEDRITALERHIKRIGL